MSSSNKICSNCKYRDIKIHRRGKYTEEVFDNPKEVFEGKCILEPTKGKCPYEPI